MTGLISLAALALVLVYIYLVSRSVYLGLVSLLVVELYNLTFGLNAQLLGGVHLNPHDVVVMSLLAAGAIRTATRLRHLNVTRILAFGFVTILAVSIIRGIFSLRILSTLNETRGYVGVLLAMLYFLTAPTDEYSIRRYVRAYIMFGAALCVVALFAGLGFHVGSVAWGNLSSSFVDGRYLPATGAAAIAVCGFLTLVVLRYRQRSLLSQFLPVLFFSAAIYLRHRTIWVMLIVGMAALFPLDGKLFRRVLPTAVLASLVVLALAVYGNRAQGLVGEGAFTQSSTNTGTWDWRVQGWEELLWGQDQEPLSIAFGKSMGTGFLRFEPSANLFINVQPHDEYVQEYLRVGVVGLTMLLMILFKAIGGLWRLRKVDDLCVYPSVSAWIIVYLMTLTFGVTYGIDAHTYALIGIGAAIGLRSYVREQTDVESEMVHEATALPRSGAIAECC